jgi:lipopolysaccharide export LptBFGC system permease protein LptF
MTFTEALLKVFSVAVLLLVPVGASATAVTLSGGAPLGWLWLWIPALVLGLLGLTYLYWKEGQ